ncbi:SlyX family protein [Chitinimonas sp.]|uniref:SlyX family protein n=1 Tax=Chitinimonas sp. TaxID=1934313 RepID=UPI002F94D6DE
MEDRITELEIRIALQDDLLDELNRVVALQQQQLELLARELRQVQDAQRNQDGGKPTSLFDEVPPHY